MSHKSVIQCSAVVIKKQRQKNMIKNHAALTYKYTFMAYVAWKINQRPSKTNVRCTLVLIIDTHKKTATILNMIWERHVYL